MKISISGEKALSILGKYAPMEVEALSVFDGHNVWLSLQSDSNGFTVGFEVPDSELEVQEK